ncbi:MAG: TetR/AcrR family transcriptional regulator [Cyclobacteriaceae bacterium]|nr:TetR/AcrR family transcriptional regulator [Cyclobacteriaceae bacterium]
MRNPEITRENILKQSGQLFNTVGYKATSLKHITDATGYTKGAIYRHFKSKDELEIETLSHLSFQMFALMKARIKAQKTAGDKLRAIFNYFETYISKPPLKGGCPLLNVAIEADDAHPHLRKRAIMILDVLRDSIDAILSNGVKHGQIKMGIDKAYYATVIIATLEGAIMMSKLKGDNKDIVRVVIHLEKLIEGIEL